MKITLDTNVLVSAFISKQGQPAAVLDIILTFPEIELVMSEPILAEFKDVLMRQEVRKRFSYSHKDVNRVVNAIRYASTIVEIRSDFKVVSEDPKDDVIVNTAFDGNADFIVSGDRHLQRLRGFKGVKIVNPRSMLNIIRQRFGELIIPKKELE